MLYLDVPYKEKDEAKALGAKWNPSLKKWYVQDKKDYYKFLKWTLGDEECATIVCDHIYIVEGERECFKCHKPTKVIGFGVENMFELSNPGIYDNVDNPCKYLDNEIHITNYLENSTDDFLKFLSQRFGYYSDYSRIAGRDFYNHCSHCGVLQGNFYLFAEVDSPFFIHSEEEAKKLTLYKIKIENDFVFSDYPSYSTTDWMIKEYAKIINLKNEFRM